MGVQPCLEKDSSCLSDGTDLLALDLTIVLENRRVLECGQECFLVSPTISYLLLQSKAVLTAYRASVSSSPILCSAILLNAMHIGDCYRDFPLRPACCRYPLVSRSRQVMSFLFWGGSMVFRQCFRLGDGNIFIAHVFLVFFSADEEKKHVYALEYFVDVWFFSLLRFSASLLCNFCRRLISLRNYLLRLMSAQLMSLTAFKTRDVFAQLLLRLMSAQLMSLTTSTSIDTIARKVQSHSRNMPDDNELRFFRDERGHSHKEELRFQ